jgi:hypothetical protein
MRNSIEKADREAERGRGSTGLLMVILFHDPPDEAMEKMLCEANWLVKRLPRNPYLSS